MLAFPEMCQGFRFYLLCELSCKILLKTCKRKKISSLVVAWIVFGWFSFFRFFLVLLFSCYFVPAKSRGVGGVKRRWRHVKARVGCRCSLHQHKSLLAQATIQTAVHLAHSPSNHHYKLLSIFYIHFPIVMKRGLEPDSMSSNVGETNDEKKERVTKEASQTTSTDYELAAASRLLKRRKFGTKWVCRRWPPKSLVKSTESRVLDSPITNKPEYTAKTNNTTVHDSSDDETVI